MSSTDIGKKKTTKPVRFCWPLSFGPIDRCAAILASLLISFQMKSYAMLCCTWRRSKVYHTVNNIETCSLKK